MTLRVGAVSWASICRELSANLNMVVSASFSKSPPRTKNTRRTKPASIFLSLSREGEQMHERVSTPQQRLCTRKQNGLRAMASVHVQVIIPKKLAVEMDQWIREGRFANRSEAIETVIALYEERERTREFYRMLLTRSDQAKRNRGSLIPLEEIP